MTRVL